MFNSGKSGNTIGSDVNANSDHVSSNIHDLKLVSSKWLHHCQPCKQEEVVTPLMRASDMLEVTQIMLSRAAELGSEQFSNHPKTSQEEKVVTPLMMALKQTPCTPLMMAINHHPQPCKQEEIVTPLMRASDKVFEYIANGIEECMETDPFVKIDLAGETILKEDEEDLYS